VYLAKNNKARNYLQGMGLRIILKCTLEKYDVRINLISSMDQLQATVDRVINVWVPKNLGSLLSENLLAAQEGLCFM